MSVPTDKELVKQVHTIIVNAYQNGTVAEHSKRKVREMLTAHFGVDLEARKKEINKMTEDQNNLVSATMEQEKRSWAKTSVSRSPSPARSAKAKAAAKGKQSNKKISAGPGRKRKQPVSDDEDEEDEDVQDDGEEVYNDAAAAAGSTMLDASNASDSEKEEDFSELEEDTSTSRSRGKKYKTSTATKKFSASASKKGRATTSVGGSEAERRLIRLKKLVSECGVLKPWKTLYTAAGISATDYARQCTVVQGVLKDLGMTGKGSLEQARKIRAEREFADELAGLQENTVLSRTARKTRGSAASVSKAIILSDDEESDYEEKPNRNSRTVQDSEDDEDEGPTRRKSFKSSLASFAADLNSDSD